MNAVFDEIANYNKNEEEDYYFILGCNENSTTEQITAEYKSRVLSCHPDKHHNDQSAHERFSRLSRAKDTLLDPEKKRDYDKWRRSGVAIPFERWQSMTHVKTSMHWGFCKEQVALGHPERPESQHLCRPLSPRSVSPRSASSSLMEDKDFQELKEKLKFTPRETSTTSKSPERDWKRDTSNPLFKKFRNYEI